MGNVYKKKLLSENVSLKMNQYFAQAIEVDRLNTLEILRAYHSFLSSQKFELIPGLTELFLDSIDKQVSLEKKRMLVNCVSSYSAIISKDFQKILFDKLFNYLEFLHISFTEESLDIVRATSSCLRCINVFIMTTRKSKTEEEIIPAPKMQDYSKLIVSLLNRYDGKQTFELSSQVDHSSQSCKSDHCKKYQTKLLLTIFMCLNTLAKLYPSAIHSIWLDLFPIQNQSIFRFTKYSKLFHNSLFLFLNSIFSKSKLFFSAAQSKYKYFNELDLPFDSKVGLKNWQFP